MSTLQQNSSTAQSVPPPFASAVDEIKARVDIVHVVSQAVKLKQVRSDRYVGLCPFHSEQRASFYVYSQTQSFCCFGCLKAGDVFTFVQEKEGLSFTRTLQVLRERYLIGSHFSRRLERPGLSTDAELAAKLFKHGLIWRIEEFLDVLKQDLPHDREDPQALLIFDTTRRLERLRTMEPYEVARLMQRLRRNCSRLVDRCIAEARELQTMLAPVVARIPPPPEDAATA